MRRGRRPSPVARAGLRLALASALALPLTAAPAAAGLLAPLVVDGQPLPPAPWVDWGLPNQSKPHTRFSVAADGAELALRIEAQASYGNLLHPLPPGTQGHHLAWRWRVAQPNPRADLHQRSGDDTAVKVCLLFDEPLANVPFLERQLLRLAGSRSVQPLPAATVCYVWDAHLGPGTAVDNAFTRRVRYLVLRGPEASGAGWLAEQRDVAVDFLRLFGDESAAVPPLLGVAVGADADNTQGHSLAWLNGLQLD